MNHEELNIKINSLFVCTTAQTLDTLDSENFGFRVICNTNTSKHIINFMQISQRGERNKNYLWTVLGDQHGD